MAIIYGTEGPDTLVGTSGPDQIYGLGGDDLIDGGGDSDSIYGGDGNDRILNGASVDGGNGDDQISGYSHLTGGAGDDRIEATGAFATVIGGAGADTLHGYLDLGFILSGTVEYLQSSSGVRVNLTTGACSGGDAEGDVVINFRTVNGSGHDDVLTGAAEHQELYGRNGNDILLGMAGNDMLQGDAGADLLIGGDGDDYILPGSDADTIDGGAGADSVSYTGSVAIFIDLTTGVASGGDAEGDSLSSIERVSTGDGDDRLIGSNVNNALASSGGADAFYGLAGDDLLAGEEGDDRLVGGAGADNMSGGAGTDWVYYHTATAAVTLSLAAGAGTGGDAAGDRYDRIEAVYGSIHGDTIIGDRYKNDLLGNTGADSLTGGAGLDVFVYRDVTDSTVGAAGRDTITDFSHAQSDRIDLRPIDADGDAANGNTAFTFTSGGTFTGSGHEVIVQVSGGAYTVLADVNGDSAADMAIAVHSATALVAGDFQL